MTACGGWYSSFFFAAAAASEGAALEVSGFFILLKISVATLG